MSDRGFDSSRGLFYRNIDNLLAPKPRHSPRVEVRPTPAPEQPGPGPIEILSRMLLESDEAQIMRQLMKNLDVKGKLEYIRDRIWTVGEVAEYSPRRVISKSLDDGSWRSGEVGVTFFDFAGYSLQYKLPPSLRQEMRFAGYETVEVRKGNAEKVVGYTQRPLSSPTGNYNLGSEMRTHQFGVTADFGLSIPGGELADHIENKDRFLRRFFGGKLSKEFYRHIGGDPKISQYQWMLREDGYVDWHMGERVPVQKLVEDYLLDMSKHYLLRQNHPLYLESQAKERIAQLRDEEKLIEAS